MFRTYVGNLFNELLLSRCVRREIRNHKKAKVALFFRYVQRTYIGYGMIMDYFHNSVYSLVDLHHLDADSPVFTLMVLRIRLSKMNRIRIHNTAIQVPCDKIFLGQEQGFGSGSVSGSTWIRINLRCWIRIRIQIADPDPDPGRQK